MQLVVFGTGALNACHLPLGVNWFRANRPHDTLRVVLSRAATRFVSPLALSALSGTTVAIDEWDDPVLTEMGASPHIDILAGADAVVVYPATLNTIGRLNSLDASTPMLNALHCNNGILIAVAPSLPPGADRNPVVRRALTALGERDNILLIEPVVRPSVSTGTDTHVPPPFWEIVPATESALTRSTHVGTSS